MKELIILGNGLSRVRCPYDKEVWGTNGTYRFAKRLDEVFVFDNEVEEIEKYQKELGFGIWASHRYPDIKVKVYPIEQVMERFDTDYFTDTVCYMLALALMDGYERLSLYGVDMPIEGEYGDGKAGVEHWVGRARGMGVQVLNTKMSSVCKSKDGLIYGFWEDRGFSQEELRKSNLELLEAGNVPGKGH